MPQLSSHAATKILHATTKTEDPSATTWTWYSQINKFFKKPTGEESVKEKGSMGEGKAHRQMGTCVWVLHCFKSGFAILSRKKHGYKLSYKERPTSQDHLNFCQNFILGSFYVSGNVSIFSKLSNFGHIIISGILL